MAIPPVEEQNDAAAESSPTPSSSSLYRCSPSSSSIRHGSNEKDDDVEFEILFQHAAESPWEETMSGADELLHDVFVDGDDVSSLYHTSNSCSPMERGEAGGASSLPSAEEVRGWVHLLEAQKKKRGGTGDEEEQTGNNSRRNKSLVVALCAFLAMTMIALIAGFASQTPRAAAAAAAAGNANVYDEALPRRSNYTEVKEFVVEHGVSSLKDFKDMSSPQVRAASWMAYVDAANLVVPPTVLYDHLDENNASSSVDDDDDDDYHDDYLARYAMAVLYFATNGENWFQQFNFLTKGDICTWKGEMLETSGTKSVPYGVDCDVDGAIRGLYLDRMGLDGFIPKEIGMLKTLRVLDLTFNDKLVGSFPKAACDFASLDSLYVGHTQIHGQLPACIGNLKKLRSLFLSDTLMSGPLPPSFSKLVAMEELMMDSNGFSGDITNMFQHMPLLQFLFLGNNQLSATLDDTFLMSSPNITQIDISDNGIAGIVPSHFFDGQSMRNLQILDLHGNHLKGTLPDNVPAPNEALQFLALQENSISGSIPISWTQNFPNLYHLDLSNNKLKGPMKPELGDMTNLRHLFLGDNPFDVGSIPTSFANLANMQEFSVKSSNRQGSIPNFIGDMTDLRLLFLGNNPFDVGPIPTSFSNLTNMQEFSVKSSNRQGNIPDFVGSSWSSLRLLDLNGNAMQGFIPDNLGNLEQLEFLFLNRNELIGQIPRSLMNLVNLRAVFLESNQLIGDLDSTLCLLPSFSFSYLRDSDALLVADCIGAHEADQEDQSSSRHQEPMACRCCKICCMVGDVHCRNMNDASTLDPNWQNMTYNRVNSDFGNSTRFVNRNYINIETSQ